MSGAILYVLPEYNIVKYVVKRSFNFQGNKIANVKIVFKKVAKLISF